MRSNLLRRMNSRLVLLGTGASTCVPNLGCLLGEGRLRRSSGFAFLCLF